MVGCSLEVPAARRRPAECGSASRQRTPRERRKRPRRGGSIAGGQRSEPDSSETAAIAILFIVLVTTPLGGCRQRKNLLADAVTATMNEMRRVVRKIGWQEIRGEPGVPPDAVARVEWSDGSVETWLADGSIDYAAGNPKGMISCTECGKGFFRLANCSNKRCRSCRHAESQRKKRTRSA